MILTPAQFDAEDHVVLSYSVLTYIGNHEDLSLYVCEVARIVSIASDMLPGLVSELRDDWDGVVWLERLQSSKEDSLAASLAWCTDPDLNLDLTTVVTLWLRRNGL